MVQKLEAIKIYEIAESGNTDNVSLLFSAYSNFALCLSKGSQVWKKGDVLKWGMRKKVDISFTKF